MKADSHVTASCKAGRVCLLLKWFDGDLRHQDRRDWVTVCECVKEGGHRHLSGHVLCLLIISLWLRF